MVGTSEERFWTQVNRADSNGCWGWLGGKNRWGYGRISANGKRLMVHRFAYELLVGPIPEGLTIDHLCRNRACVNPAHLEAVDIRTNLLRGNGWSGLQSRKTHCPQGHPYDAQNTYYEPNKHRRCRTCGLLYERKRHDATYWRSYRAKRRKANANSISQ